MSGAETASSSAAGPSTSRAKLPKPHRCNARVEDFVQSLVTWDFSGKIQPAWKNMRQCFKSEPGQETTEPYLVIKDPQAYLDPHRMYQPRPGMGR
ncbi:hypothetical protein ABPG77_002922 [Micractinium sp. CCAP 211/92]